MIVLNPLSPHHSHPQPPTTFPFSRFKLFGLQSPNHGSIRTLIRYASRAGIRRDAAIKAHAAGFKAARADIDAALTWWLANLPEDDRVISDMRRFKASIDAAEGQ